MGAASIFEMSIFAAAAITLSVPAQASTSIDGGTVTLANLYSPAVDTTTDPATFSDAPGMPHEVFGTGSFSDVTGLSWEV